MPPILQDLLIELVLIGVSVAGLFLLKAKADGTAKIGDNLAMALGVVFTGTIGSAIMLLVNKTL